MYFKQNCHARHTRVCRLLSSLVLLRKLTNTSANCRGLGVARIFVSSRVRITFHILLLFRFKISNLFLRCLDCVFTVYEVASDFVALLGSFT